MGIIGHRLTLWALWATGWLYGHHGPQIVPLKLVAAEAASSGSIPVWDL